MARLVMGGAPRGPMKLFVNVEQLRDGLDYHLARHNLLTANLAHADTPGYKPLDLERSSTFEGALGAALATTEPGHLGGSTAGAAQGFHVVEDATAQAAGADGNAVSLDREAVKIASNQLRYDTLASLVQNELSGLAWAAQDGRSG
jgi:flagellar basal-body rod protein FlgB